MKLWMVYVKPYGGVRYLDGVYASKEHAEERQGQLRRYWAVAGNSEIGHTAAVIEGTLEDGRLVGPEAEPAEAEPATCRPCAK